MFKLHATRLFKGFEGVFKIAFVFQRFKQFQVSPTDQCEGGLAVSLDANALPMMAYSVGYLA